MISGSRCGFYIGEESLPDSHRMRDYGASVAAPGWARRKTFSHQPITIWVSSSRPSQNFHPHRCDLEIGHPGKHICHCGATLRELTVAPGPATYALLKVFGYVIKVALLIFLLLLLLLAFLHK
jgi:hypothetical protein